MRLLLAATLFCAILAGCSNVPLSPAPVVNRTATPIGSASLPAAAAPAASAASSATAPIPAGYYRVQHGDTLRSIARGVGHGWRQLAAWNNLSDPNRIEVGQLLRVAPPGAPGAQPSLARSSASTPAQPAGVQVFPLAPAGAASGGAAPAPRASAAAAHAPVSRPKPVGAAASAAPPQQRPQPPAAGAFPPPPSLHSQAGGLEWSWPAQGPVLRGFNDSTRKGIDIGGRAGEPVRAAAAGKVVYAGNELRGFGNLLIVKQNDEYISVYAHNQQLLVRDGQDVRRGQVIALMGSTDAPRVELHFEIRVRGKPVDPLQILPHR